MTDEELLTLCGNMRECFPKGLKPGTNNPWRDHVSIVKNRLHLLSKHFDYELDAENILKATKFYVDSFDGDYTYMRTLRYFIIKRTVIDGTTEYISDLLSYMNMMEEGENVHNTNNWVGALK